jgi:cephalosporin-C deacetylase-like acetyl esterase
MPPKSPSADSVNFYVSAHGYELCREDGYYAKLRKAVQSNGFGHGFDPEQNQSPYTCYFRGMALRALRAMDYLKTRPEWDKKNLLVAGGSQGALQSMWCAAFAPGVTEAWLVIPWLCDVGGTEAGRNHGDWFPKWARGLDYFDQVNVAKRVPSTCYVAIVRIGLGDYIAPPCGTAIMYRALKCPKKAIWVQGATHSSIPVEPQKITW